MKKTKLNFANANSSLSRSEMKNIMAGSGSENCYTAQCRSTSAWLGNVDVTSCSRDIVEAACKLSHPATSMSDTTCSY
jgi:hypothetical protein